MPNNALAITCLVAAMLTAGCSAEYEHDRLDAESPEFRAVGAMLDELRNAGPDRLDDVLTGQLVDGLDSAQQEGLQKALSPLARADRAYVECMDRWGDFYRATITYTDADGDHAIAFLLLPGDDDDTLLWVRMN